MSATTSSSARWTWLSTKLKFYFYSRFTNYGNELQLLTEVVKKGSKETMKNDLTQVFVTSQAQPHPNEVMIEAMTNRFAKYIAAYHRMKTKLTPKQEVEIKLFIEIRKNEDEIKRLATEKSMRRAKKRREAEASKVGNGKEGVVSSEVKKPTEMVKTQPPPAKVEPAQIVPQVQQQPQPLQSPQSTQSPQPQQQPQQPQQEPQKEQPPQQRQQQQQPQPRLTVSLPTQVPRNPASLFQILRISTPSDIPQPRNWDKDQASDRGSHGLSITYNIPNTNKPMAFQTLASFMSRFGSLTAVILSNDNSNPHIGFAFVQYSTFSAASAALDGVRKLIECAEGREEDEGENNNSFARYLVDARWAEVGNKVEREGNNGVECSKKPVWYGEEEGRTTERDRQACQDVPSLGVDINTELSLTSTSMPNTFDPSKLIVSDKEVQSSIDKLATKHKMLLKAIETLSQEQSSENKESNELKLQKLQQSVQKIETSISTFVSKNKHLLVTSDSSSSILFNPLTLFDTSLPSCDDYKTKEDAFKQRAVLLKRLGKMKEGVCYENDVWMMVRRQLLVVMLPCYSNDKGQMMDVQVDDAKVFVANRMKTLGIVIDGIGTIGIEKYKEELRKIQMTRRKPGANGAWVDSNCSGDAKSSDSVSGLFPDDIESMAAGDTDRNEDSEKESEGEGSDRPMEVETEGIAYNDNTTDRVVVRIADSVPPSYMRYGFDGEPKNGKTEQNYIDEMFLRSSNKTKTASEILSRNGFTVRYFACELPMEDLKP